MQVCAIVPAAGRSARFGESDKLSQDLGGRPLLIRTVEALARRDEVMDIIVAGPPDHLDAFRERFGPTLGFHGARVVAGSTTSRTATVRAALAEVGDAMTHIAVHDAARPGPPTELLDRVFDAARSVAAVIPAVPVAGTVKRVTEHATDVSADEDDAAVLDSILGEAGRRTVEAWSVVETVDRTNLVEVQTPQVFAADLLRRAYEASDAEDATDDATLVERLGEPVQVITGDPRNLKVTTPADLPVMRALMGLKAPAERPAHLRF